MARHIRVARGAWPVARGARRRGRMALALGPGRPHPSCMDEPSDAPEIDLTGQLLIAMPGMATRASTGR